MSIFKPLQARLSSLLLSSCSANKRPPGVSIGGSLGNQHRSITSKQLEAAKNGVGTARGAHHSLTPSDRERVVILGSGWAGYNLAHSLNPKRSTRQSLCRRDPTSFSRRFSLRLRWVPWSSEQLSNQSDPTEPNTSTSKVEPMPLTLGRKRPWSARRFEIPIKVFCRPEQARRKMRGQLRCGSRPVAASCSPWHMTSW